MHTSRKYIDLIHIDIHIMCVYIYICMYMRILVCMYIHTVRLASYVCDIKAS